MDDFGDLETLNDGLDDHEDFEDLDELDGLEDDYMPVTAEPVAEEPVAEKVEPVYFGVEDFVTDYLAANINRKLSTKPGKGLMWDAYWWRHDEVVARLTALWFAWEEAYANTDDAAAVSAWWIQHCEPHMRVLFDGETGPMSGALPDGTWMGHGPLRSVPAPAGILPDEPWRFEEIEPVFSGVEQFVNGYFARVVNRNLSPAAGRGLIWDARWWRYREVVTRLTTLWHAWENARASEDGSAMSAWWIHHADPHLRILLDGDTGPMSGSSSDGTWRDHGALPSIQAPSGHFST